MGTISTEVVLAAEKRDSRGRAIADKQRRREVLAEYDRSGMTQRAFAKREGIKYATFVNWLAWRRRAQRNNRAGPTFAEVQLGPVRSVSRLEVMLPSGVVIRGEDAREIAQLMRALEGRC
jgi:hypothetical protein